MFPSAGRSLSLTAHTDLAGRAVCLQGPAAGGGRVHGLGDAPRQDTRPERLTVHRRLRVQCGHYQRHCCRPSQPDLGARHAGLHYHNGPHTDLHHSDALPTVYSQATRHLGTQ